MRRTNFAGGVVVLLTTMCASSVRRGHAFATFPLPVAGTRVAHPRSVAARRHLVPLPSVDDLDVVVRTTTSSTVLPDFAASLGIVLPQTAPLYSSSKYLFMLPTATLVSTSCQLAGIGGAALFSPLFLLVFPLFDGLELASPSQAVASALLTEVFGFASGLSGYARRGLVDWTVAGRLVVVSVPSALVGARSAGALADDALLLRVLYAALMLGLAVFLTVAPRPDALVRANDDDMDEECVLPDDGDGLRTLTTADGTSYTYRKDGTDGLRGVGATTAGAALTGLLGVGVGEVVLPQLVRGRCMPLPVAAGTSVAVVVATALTAAVVQFAALASTLSAASLDGCNDVSAFLSVVPWDLVQYTIPGVLLGGQLAPLLASQGRFDDEQIERFAATLFAIVGVAFAVKAATG